MPGIIFPISIAPFQIVVSPLNTKDAEVRHTSLITSTSELRRRRH
jgi:hypothetical protein